MNIIEQKNLISKLHESTGLPYSSPNHVEFASTTTIGLPSINNAFTQLVDNDLYIENKLANDYAYTVGPKAYSEDVVANQENGYKTWGSFNATELSILQKIDLDLSASIEKIFDSECYFTVKHEGVYYAGTNAGIKYTTNLKDWYSVNDVPTYGYCLYNSILLFAAADGAYHLIKHNDGTKKIVKITKENICCKQIYFRTEDKLLVVGTENGKLKYTHYINCYASYDDLDKNAEKYKLYNSWIYMSYPEDKRMTTVYPNTIFDVTTGIYPLKNNVFVGTKNGLYHNSLSSDFYQYNDAFYKLSSRCIQKYDDDFALLGTISGLYKFDLPNEDYDLQISAKYVDLSVEVKKMFQYNKKTYVCANELYEYRHAYDEDVESEDVDKLVPLNIIKALKAYLGLPETEVIVLNDAIMFEKNGIQLTVVATNKGLYHTYGIDYTEIQDDFAMLNNANVLQLLQKDTRGFYVLYDNTNNKRKLTYLNIPTIINQKIKEHNTAKIVRNADGVIIDSTNSISSIYGDACDYINTIKNENGIYYIISNTRIWRSDDPTISCDLETPIASMYKYNGVIVVVRKSDEDHVPVQFFDDNLVQKTNPFEFQERMNESLQYFNYNDARQALGYENFMFFTARQTEYDYKSGCIDTTAFSSANTEKFCITYVDVNNYYVSKCQYLQSPVNGSESTIYPGKDGYFDVCPILIYSSGKVYVYDVKNKKIDGHFKILTQYVNAYVPTFDLLDDRGIDSICDVKSMSYNKMLSTFFVTTPNTSYYKTIDSIINDGSDVLKIDYKRIGATENRHQQFFELPGFKQYCNCINENNLYVCTERGLHAYNLDLGYPVQKTLQSNGNRYELSTSYKFTSISKINSSLMIAAYDSKFLNSGSSDPTKYKLVVVSPSLYSNTATSAYSVNSENILSVHNFIVANPDQNKNEAYDFIWNDVDGNISVATCKFVNKYAKPTITTRKIEGFENHPTLLCSQKTTIISDKETTDSTIYICNRTDVKKLNFNDMTTTVIDKISIQPTDKYPVSLLPYKYEGGINIDVEDDALLYSIDSITGVTGEEHTYCMTLSSYIYGILDNTIKESVVESKLNFSTNDTELQNVSFTGSIIQYINCNIIDDGVNTGRAYFIIPVVNEDGTDYYIAYCPYSMKIIAAQFSLSFADSSMKIKKLNLQLDEYSYKIQDETLYFTEKTALTANENGLSSISLSPSSFTESDFEVQILKSEICKAAISYNDIFIVQLNNVGNYITYSYFNDSIDVMLDSTCEPTYFDVGNLIYFNDFKFLMTTEINSETNNNVLRCYSDNGFGTIDITDNFDVNLECTKIEYNSNVSPKYNLYALCERSIESNKPTTLYGVSVSFEDYSIKTFEQLTGFPSSTTFNNNKVLDFYVDDYSINVVCKDNMFHKLKYDESGWTTEDVDMTSMLYSNGFQYQIDKIYFERIIDDNVLPGKSVNVVNAALEIDQTYNNTYFISPLYATDVDDSCVTKNRRVWLVQNDGKKYLGYEKEHANINNSDIETIFYNRVYGTKYFDSRLYYVRKNGDIHKICELSSDGSFNVLTSGTTLTSYTDAVYFMLNETDTKLDNINKIAFTKQYLFVNGEKTVDETTENVWLYSSKLSIDNCIKNSGSSFPISTLNIDFIQPYDIEDLPEEIDILNVYDEDEQLYFGTTNGYWYSSYDGKISFETTPTAKNVIVQQSSTEEKIRKIFKSNGYPKYSCIGVVQENENVQKVYGAAFSKDNTSIILSCDDIKICKCNPGGNFAKILIPEEYDAQNDAICLVSGENDISAYKCYTYSYIYMQNRQDMYDRLLSAQNIQKIDGIYYVLGDQVDADITKSSYSFAFGNYKNGMVCFDKINSVYRSQNVQTTLNIEGNTYLIGCSYVDDTTSCTYIYQQNFVSDLSKLNLNQTTKGQFDGTTQINSLECVLPNNNYESPTYFAAIDNGIYESTNLLTGFQLIANFNQISTIYDIYALSKNKMFLPTDSGMHFIEPKYKLVNNIKKLNAIDILNLYYQNLSVIDNLYDAQLQHHLAVRHNNNSTITIVNDNKMNIELDNIDDEWQSYAEQDSEETIYNDLLFSIDIGKIDKENSNENIIANVASYIGDYSNVNINYIVKRWMSGITELYINIPTTYTYYLNHVLGTPNCTMNPNTLLTRKNLSQLSSITSKQKKTDSVLSSHATIIDIALQESEYHIDYLLEATINGNSLPLKIYRDNTDQHYDGASSRLYQSFVVPSVVESFDAETELNGYKHFRFKCFGTDAQAIKLQFMDYNYRTTTQHFTIVFNSNTGAGKLQPQRVPLYQETTLKKNNRIYKTGAIFIGWSLHPEVVDMSTPMFNDGATISKNLLEEFGKVDNLHISDNDEITLFAVWKFYNFPEEDIEDADTTMVTIASKMLPFQINSVEVEDTEELQNQVAIDFDDGEEFIY